MQWEFEMWLIEAWCKGGHDPKMDPAYLCWFIPSCKDSAPEG